MKIGINTKVEEIKKFVERLIDDNSSETVDSLETKGQDEEELPENPIGDSMWVDEEPEEIPLLDDLYWNGDDEDLLMAVEPSHHFYGVHMDYEGGEVEIIGARPYSGLDGIVVRYITPEGKVNEANPSFFRLSDEEEQELIGEAYGGSIYSNRTPAALRDDKFTADLADGIAWLEGEGQAEKREPLSTLYSTKDTRDLLLERVVFGSENSWDVFDEFLGEAWLKYAEDIDVDPESGGISRNHSNGSDYRVYSIETENMDFPVQFEAREEEGLYVLSPMDSRLSGTEEMKMLNIFDRLADIAGRYEVEEYESDQYLLAPQ